MGEFTDALRHARRERGRREEPRPAEPPAESGEGDRALAPSPPRGDPPPPGPAAAATEQGGEPAVHIRDLKEGAWAGRAVLVDHQGGFAEHFRQFALRVGRELELRGTRTVLFTSAVPWEGKTTTACNTALAFASMAAGRRIALVELDLRRPSIHEALGVEPPRIGFDRVLRGEVPLDAARIHSDAGLDLFLVAESADNAHEILARGELGGALRALAQSYDTVVFDTPPVLAVPDVSLVIPHVGACVTVVRTGATPLSAYRAMLDVLPMEKVVGAFLNDSRTRRLFRKYDYYHRYREGSETE